MSGVRIFLSLEILLWRMWTCKFSLTVRRFLHWISLWSWVSHSLERQPLLKDFCSSRTMVLSPSIEGSSLSKKKMQFWGGHPGHPRWDAPTCWLSSHGTRIIHNASSFEGQTPAEEHPSWKVWEKDQRIGLGRNLHKSNMSCTSSAAQGGGGVSQIGNHEERLVVVNHGWQSEPTDGPKGGWSCVFWTGCNGCSGHLTTPVGCSVV